MKLYSKRNSKIFSRLSIIDSSREKGKIIPDTLRVRLRHELKYIVGCKFLEHFLLINDETKKITKLHCPTIKEFSDAELGYDVTAFINLDDFTFKDEQFDDFKFFDLIEFFIIFSAKGKREELISRLNKIFDEEGKKFIVHGYMIVARENEGLNSVSQFIKDATLQTKVQDYYRNKNTLSPNFELLSRISADIVQLIFSDPIEENGTKLYAENLCSKLASQWTEENKVAELTNLLNEVVKNAKSLSNQISNIRHTDRSTIPVSSPDFFKLISSKNISIAELVILSLPELFISEKDAEDLKNYYLDRYGIDKNSGWVVQEKEINTDEIDVRDIPF